ncbi:MAG: hypothetical protein PHO41_03935 [Eubacteriales bacterium]|nr:hypothetical protein [Eubacteriales bacterium]
MTVKMKKSGLARLLVFTLLCAALLLCVPGTARAFYIDGFHGEAVGDYQIRLSWTLSSAITKYMLYCNGESRWNFSQNISYAVVGVFEPGTRYSFYLTGYNDLGLVATSGTIYVYTKHAPPTGLHLDAATDSSITLAWDSTSGADHYKVYQDGSYLADSPDASYTVNGITPGTEHAYKVSAITPDGTVGEFSSTVRMRTLCAAPANLQVGMVTTGSISLVWDAADSASHYDVYRDGTYLAQVTGTSYTDSGLPAGTEYSYKVLAGNESGDSAFSDTVSVSTRCDAPQNLRLATKTHSAITMAWDAVTGASHYRVYQDGVYVESVTGTSCVRTGLSSNSIYGFKVAAVASDGELSAYSGHCYVRTAKLRCAAPQNLRVTAKTRGSITIAWNAVLNASHYRYYQNGVCIGTTTGTSMVCGGLDTNTIYGFKVAAVSADGVTGDYAGHIYVRTAKEYLDAPQNLRQTSVTPGAVTMAWNAVEGAAYYRFYLNGSYLANVTGTVYTCEGLDANCIYGFKVAAVNRNGTVGTCTGHCYVRTESGKLPAPKNLRAAEVTEQSIKMFWNAVPGASYYRFYRNGVFVGTTPNAWFTSVGLDSGTVYGFKVAAVCEEGILGQYSGHVYIRTEVGQ